MNFPSKILENAVSEFAKLPGIGNKTALRLVLHLLRQEKHDVEQFAHSISHLINNIQYCSTCHNISDTSECNICTSKKRDHTLICVVESVKDVMAIENTSQYNGVYHVLGGVISPINAVGPGELTIDALEERLKMQEIKELILALPTTMEGDTTNFYLYKRFHNENLKISLIARGISVGDDLEYADEVTLGRSILKRTEFHGVL